ncbi:MAG TPA: alpha/beta hydrolase [Anaerolineae bacterium]|nr:alpha/beta hydrolase [Anaerolineae bacterium]HQI86733.1 alpha/beta hydrolase [Anaerolineae bacterium]
MPIYLIGALSLLGALALIGYLYEKRAEASDARRFPPPGQLVDVGGHKLHLLCMGEKQPGQPTVILESGHGAWSNDWRTVQPEIARFARVCAYDRAGFGWSEPGPRPRTPERIMTELHTLLTRAGEAGPYLLVGHSMGGPLARLFFTLYPQDVAGMVWIDSGHENMPRYIPFVQSAFRSFIVLARVGAFLARFGLIRLFGRRRILAGYTSVREPEARATLLAQTVRPQFLDALGDETATMTWPAQWARAPQTLGDLPVIALEVQYDAEVPTGYTPARWEMFRAGWRAIHEDLSALSSNTRRIPVQGGHNVMAEQPELVVQAVRDLLAYC